MKNLLDSLRTVGANDKTINFVLQVFVLFLFLVGIGSMAVIVIQILRNETPSPAIIAIITVLFTAAAGLITVSHTTAQINGTVAQSAQQASNVENATAERQTAAIAAAVKAVFDAQKQADAHTLDLQKIVTAATVAPPPNTEIATTDAIAENTQATIENTAAMQGTTSTTEPTANAQETLQDIPPKGG
jgi:hypothetical protein